MISAIDTNILLDIFLPDKRYAAESAKLLKISFKRAREVLGRLGKIGRYSPEIIANGLVSLWEERDDKTHNHKDT